MKILELLITNGKGKIMKSAKFGLFAILFCMFTIQCDSSRKPIKIGVNSWPPCEIWYIAQEMGFLGKTKVELVRFSAWTDNMQSLYFGNTDITHATYFNALYYANKGEKGEIILKADTIQGGEGLVVKNHVKNGLDLKNRKIAVEIGTDEHFLLYKALSQIGLTINDVKLIPSTSVQAKDMFIAGEVDACFTYEPYLSQATAQGNGRILLTTHDFPGYMIDVLVGRSSVIKERKKDYQNIIKAWYKAQEYIRKNPEKAFALMAKNENMEPPAFRVFYGGFTFFSLAENRKLLQEPALKSKLMEINDFLFNTGLIKEKVNIDEVLNNSIVEDI